MGSITSKPKTPTIITVPSAPVVTVPTTVTASTSEGVDTQTSEEARTEARESSLLRRARGRFGTIATSFRGLLGDENDSTEQPKTLLGE